METKIVEYNEDITELFNVLMTLEMQLVEQLEVRLEPLGGAMAGRILCKNGPVRNRVLARTLVGAPLLATCVLQLSVMDQCGLE